MEKTVLKFLYILWVVPLIIGNDDIECEKAVNRDPSICIKNLVIVKVNKTSDTLLIIGIEFTSIAPNAFQNLSIKTLTLAPKNSLQAFPESPVILKPESFGGLEKLNKLSIFGAILSLDENIFEAMPSLTYLELGWSKIVEVKLGPFSGLPNLQSLLISHANISIINKDTFDGIQNISLLALEDISISTLKPNTFESLKNLKYLGLGMNQLTDIEPGVFNGLDKLEILVLTGNQLTVIRKNVFNHLNKLWLLSLEKNEINFIEAGAFDGLSVRYLNLECNRLKVIPTGSFYGASITLLQIGCNDDLTIDENAFNNATIKNYNGPELLGDIKKVGSRRVSGSALKALLPMFSPITCSC